MTNWKLMIRLPVLILAAAVVSGCDSSTGSFANSAGTNSSSSTGSSGYPVPTPSPSSSSIVTGTGPNPAQVYGGIIITGQGGAAPTYDVGCESTNFPCNNPSLITTSNLLKVQVTPEVGGDLDLPGDFSAFSATYNCVSYSVSVYDSNANLLATKNTGMLAVSSTAPCMDGGGNPITTPSQILDFSSVLSQGADGVVDVTVSAVNYDFYCKLWYQQYDLYGPYSEFYQDFSYWCPSKVVYPTHTVGVQLGIAINGESF